jgi:hypothetical protein
LLYPVHDLLGLITPIILGEKVREPVLKTIKNIAKLRFVTFEKRNKRF